MATRKTKSNSAKRSPKSGGKKSHKKNPKTFVADPKSALRVEEAAHKSTLGRNAIYREIREGRLKIAKVGRRTIIPVAEFNRWLQLITRGSN
jgi:excisionase family DNA binding protein